MHVIVTSAHATFENKETTGTFHSDHEESSFTVKTLQRLTDQSICTFESKKILKAITYYTVDFYRPGPTRHYQH